MTNSDKTRLDDIGILALVGAGKMGGAMLEGWLALGLDPKNVVVIEPQPSPEIVALSQKGVALNPPAGAVSNIAHHRAGGEAADRGRCAAGGRGDDRARHAGALDHGRQDAGLPAIRTAESRDRARDAEYPGRDRPRHYRRRRRTQAVTAEQKMRAQHLLAASGAVEWISDESLMDAVTAVSGSGPAYVFLLAETLTKAGIAAGLPEALAAKLARETVAGSGELLHRSPLDPATLRENVTSPGGTTAAALEVLMAADGLDPLMRAAVTGRGKALA